MPISSLQLFQQAILKLADKGTERTYYPPFCNFISSFFEEQGTKDIIATAEESSKNLEDGVGFPDITVRQKNRLIGWIEVKLPDDDIGNKKFEKQFKKYRDSLENIVFTNFRQWELWQWDTEGKSKKIDEITFDIQDFAIGAEKTLEKFLIKFFEGQAYDVRTPKQLALALAKKTRLLSQQVEENFDEEDEHSDLGKLKKTFQETLIQDISVHQFSNMVAETLAYSLFLAGLEYADKHPTQSFTLTTAIDYLPKNVPILRDLYDLVKKVSTTIPNIHKSAESLVDQINNADIERIRYKLTEHKPGEDPVIQFYEPFLNEYDPKEQEARGVYYTPKPVVDFIVRSVDHLLETKFDKKDGLADKDVNILDPATGTGTFLMSAIQQVYFRINKKYEALGIDLVRKNFNDIVLKHILKHFYGFELMIAPYAIAHLKLTLELERLGFDFAVTYKDGDSDNDRFQVFLANTLDNPDAPPKDFFGYDSISKESEKARHVKKNKPILAILGNPPYSGISQNAVEQTIILKGKKKKVKTWIGELIEHYKYTDEGHFGERKHWLGDDYVKFIRFTQWKIAQTGQGVIGMITNNGFLDNPTFRGMRYQLMQEFDEIYILDLHGNSKRKENQGEEKDQNVFDQVHGVGASITFFVKHEKKLEKTRVFRTDLYGDRISKRHTLLDTEFEKFNWVEIEPKSPMYIFDTASSDTEFYSFWDIEKIIADPNNKSTGVQTSRDELAVAFTKNELEQRINEVMSTHNLSEIELKYSTKDTYFWNLKDAQSKLIKDGGENIEPYTYRPFDNQYFYFSTSITHRTRSKVMRHMTFPNLALCIGRAGNAVGSETWNLVFCAKFIQDLNLFYRGGSVGIPLYLYPETNQENLLGETKRTPNINPEFLKAMEEKLGIKFDPNLFLRIRKEDEENEKEIKLGEGRKYADRWDKFMQETEEGKQYIAQRQSDKYFGPEDIFYYAYAVFHCPTYRTRYAEQLKIDFPRLPLTEDKELFKKLVQKGNELVNLHLLGENPFDEAETIFDDNSKWHVSVGGTKPENTEDWKVEMVEYVPADKRVYVNKEQYFEGIEKETWKFMIGGYQVLDKWLKDRKKAERCLSTDDLMHYMKIVVSLRETIRIMHEIDTLIPKWPMK